MLSSVNIACLPNVNAPGDDIHSKTAGIQIARITNC